MFFSFGGIGDDGAAHFKDALCSTNSKLQVLDLSSNNIGADGAAHFKEAPVQY